MLEQPESNGGDAERVLPGAPRRPDAYLPHAPQGAARARRVGRSVSETVALVFFGDGDGDGVGVGVGVGVGDGVGVGVSVDVGGGLTKAR